MRIVLLIFILINVVSCASYQEGIDARIVEGKHPQNTPIFGFIDQKFSTKYYTLFHFSFGNENDTWTRIESVNLDFNDDALNKKVNVILGEDLQTWSESIAHKIKVDNYNSELLLGSIALAGSAFAIGSANKGDFANAKFGLAVTSGAITLSAINELNSQKESLARTNLLPEGHLYRPFAIPAGLVTKRWILVDIKESDIPKKVFLNITYQGGNKVRYEVPTTSDYNIE